MLHFIYFVLGNNPSVVSEPEVRNDHYDHYDHFSLFWTLSSSLSRVSSQETTWADSAWVKELLSLTVWLSQSVSYSFTGQHTNLSTYLCSLSILQYSKYFLFWVFSNVYIMKMMPVFLLRVEENKMIDLVEVRRQTNRLQFSRSVLH